MAHCCGNCFGDRGLRRTITTIVEATGKCSYCHSENVELVTPVNLADYFDPLINVYEPNDDGKTLVEWLKQDWGMFDHAVMDDAHAKELLADVLNNGEIVRRKFVPRAIYKTDTLARWEALRDELMYKNRYFPDAGIDSARFEILLALLVADPVQATWFRARIKTEEQTFPIDKMGPPPKRISTAGRANPPGIQYLYLGSTLSTAIAEIRPHTGEIVCVATFTIAAGLKLIDLRRPKRMASPFLVGDNVEAIGLVRSDVAFLERLGEELTRPVIPQGAAIDYVPSQYLCEFIKKRGYDGVLYNSSVSDGMNLALFEGSKATGGAVSEHKVTRVTVEIG